MSHSRGHDKVHPEVPLGWPQPGHSGLDPMENYANAGRFAGFVMARAWSRPLRPKGPYSSAAMLVFGLTLFSFAAFVIAWLITDHALDLAAKAVATSVMLVLAYGSVCLVRGGTTGLITARHRHIRRQPHPHRGPNSPH